MLHQHLHWFCAGNAVCCIYFFIGPVQVLPFVASTSSLVLCRYCRLLHLLLHWFCAGIAVCCIYFFIGSVQVMPFVASTSSLVLCRYCRSFAAWKKALYRKSVALFCPIKRGSFLIIVSVFLVRKNTVNKHPKFAPYPNPIKELLATTNH